MPNIIFYIVGLAIVCGALAWSFSYARTDASIRAELGGKRKLPHEMDESIRGLRKRHRLWWLVVLILGIGILWFAEKLYSTSNPTCAFVYNLIYEVSLLLSGYPQVAIEITIFVATFLLAFATAAVCVNLGVKRAGRRYHLTCLLPAIAGKRRV